MCILSSAFVALLALAALAPLSAAPQTQTREELYDLVIYGGTSAGVSAGIQAAKQGLRVLVIEASPHLGGLSSAGLGATDIGNKAAIGGLAREFYRRVGTHYARDEAWIFEERERFRSGRQRAGEAEMWVFEPKVAEGIFDVWIAEAGVDLVRGDGLERSKGVQKSGNRIEALALKSGRVVRGRCFVDATYEGDLLPGAGVAYTVGREANATYGETWNGVQPELPKHQFEFAVDPYRVPGDPASGLLPEISAELPGARGTGDAKVQAYCFRMCLTDVEENRRPFPRPADYDAARYELLARYFAAGFAQVPWNPIEMPNRKTDTNNNTAFSTDWIGGSWTWAEASDEERARLLAAHRDYQMGLLWFLANDPRVPERVQREVRRFGLPKDEFVATGGWPHALYVREARRMIGAYVMSEADCVGKRRCEDSIGLAAYTMDSHNVQRYAAGGRVWNEGDVQVGGFPPYPISLRSIVPVEEQCANLLVPCALSASHIAFGSIRMEPVFQVLGQSAATIAAEALASQTSVQRVDYARVRARLIADGQRL
jgi:hypothetical protein